VRRELEEPALRGATLGKRSHRAHAKAGEEVVAPRGEDLAPGRVEIVREELPPRLGPLHCSTPTRHGRESAKA
jgi:hypothetical protein